MPSAIRSARAGSMPAARAHANARSAPRIVKSSPGTGIVAPQIVDQRGTVKQLAIERLAVERRQRHAPHPGPVRMGDQQIELLSTRRLGLTREPRVGWLEVAHVDA